MFIGTAYPSLSYLDELRWKLKLRVARGPVTGKRALSGAEARFSGAFAGTVAAKIGVSRC